MAVCKKWTLAKAFSGHPDASNFKLETEELPKQLKEGGTLLSYFYLHCLFVLIRKLIR